VEIVWPIRTPLLDTLFNKYVGRLWPFHYFAIASFLIARPRPKLEAREEPVVSVIVPARNEEGNIPNIFDRVPQMGAGTELIFVEGNSTDDTYRAVEREIARRPGTRVKLFKQPGKGKGDAVRVGFREASGDLLMILDADLTVPRRICRVFTKLGDPAKRSSSTACVWYIPWRKSHALFSISWE